MQTKRLIRTMMKTAHKLLKSYLWDLLRIHTELVGMKDPNMALLSFFDQESHLEVKAKLDIPTPPYPRIITLFKYKTWNY